MGDLQILIVEDSFSDRELYKRFLKRNGYCFDIYEAERAADGIAYSREHDFDCVILDFNLPDADGLDFITTFKEESRDPDGAIVMVTGQGSEETAVEAMKSGAADYITKNNINNGFFLHTILNAIERAQLRRKVRDYQEYLEQSNKALSEFAHTVSHDLKAPLRRLIAFCDLLEEECSDSLDDKGRNYVERITANAWRMQKFIDDLLAFSRVLHGHEKYELLDMNNLVKEILDDIEPLIQESGARITVDDLPPVPVYPTKIRQLFLNLITNAIKYHGESDPLIRISCEDSNGHYTFVVEDNGQGIAPEYQKDIFKAFERLHSNDAVEGTGLGLSICQKVVEMHKGRIWVESEVGAGSRFYFSLPKEKPVLLDQEEVGKQPEKVEIEDSIQIA